MIPFCSQASKNNEEGMEECRKAAYGLEEELKRIRGDLHGLAEPSGREERTAEYLARFCRGRGWKVVFHEDIHALTADIGEGSSRTALRADMDALPVPGGAAHLCGHDMHMTMALGAGMVLERLGVPARLLFQPKEEAPPGGAVLLVERGALEGVGAVFGLHVEPMIETGRVITRRGPFLAAADNFEVELHGEGGHAAAPHRANDLVLASAAVVVSAQAVVSRFTDPVEAAVVSFASVEAGGNYNVLPSRALLRGTIRSYSEELQRFLFERLEETARHAAAMYGARAAARRFEGYPPLVNHAREVELGREVYAGLFGEDGFEGDHPPLMFGEDFGYYLKERPGAFFMIGASPGEGARPLHNVEVEFDEAVLPMGAAFLAALAAARAGRSEG